MCPNLQHLFIGELGRMMFLAVGWVRNDPTLFGFVAHVVIVGPEEEVRWIHARRVVAPM
jgi:hypothetical protein